MGAATQPPGWKAGKESAYIVFAVPLRIRCWPAMLSPYSAVFLASGCNRFMKTKYIPTNVWECINISTRSPLSNNGIICTGSHGSTYPERKTLVLVESLEFAPMLFCEDLNMPLELLMNWVRAYLIQSLTRQSLALATKAAWMLYRTLRSCTLSVRFSARLMRRHIRSPPYSLLNRNSR